MQETVFPVIGVSKETYDILNRIAEDFDISIKDVADQMIMQGLKWSSFRRYATSGSAKEQAPLSSLVSTDKPVLV